MAAPRGRGRHVRLQSVTCVGLCVTRLTVSPCHGANLPRIRVSQSHTSAQTRAPPATPRAPLLLLVTAAKQYAGASARRRAAGD
eukprot:4401321-Prymnesium_polylepis.1